MSFWDIKEDDWQQPNVSDKELVETDLSAKQKKWYIRSNNGQIN